MSYQDGISGRRPGRAAAGSAAGSAAGGGCGCGLAPATLVATRSGPVPVSRLRPGDLLLTRDSGYLPLLWSGHGQRAAAGGLGRRAVAIAPGALGPGMPERTLRLAAGHGLLVDASALVPVLATAEALAPAATVGQALSVQPRGGFIQIVLASHELILADGAWVESLPPAAAFHAFPRRALALIDPMRAEGEAPLRPRIAPAGLVAPLPLPGLPDGEQQSKRKFRVA